MNKLEELENKYRKQIKELKSLAVNIRITTPNLYFKICDEITELEIKLNQIYRVTGKFDNIVKDIEKINDSDLVMINEDIVMSTLFANGISRDTIVNVAQTSYALHCQHENNFRVKTRESINPFKTQLNAIEFNNLNSNLEIILNAGYNACVTSQYCELDKLFNKKNLMNEPVETVANLGDKLDLFSHIRPVSYSEFDAKYNTLHSVLTMAESGDIKLSKCHKLYIYNSIINLLNDVKTERLNTTDKLCKENLVILKAMENENFDYILNGIGDKEITKLQGIVLGKATVLNELRQNLEKSLFGKSEEKFNMRKSLKMFEKSAINLLTNNKELAM